MVGIWHWRIPTFIITDISTPWWDFVMVGICRQAINIIVISIIIVITIIVIELMVMKMLLFWYLIIRLIDHQVRMREVQGAICIASIVQLVIGYTGICVTYWPLTSWQCHWPGDPFNLSCLSDVLHRHHRHRHRRHHRHHQDQPEANGDGLKTHRRHLWPFWLELSGADKT